MKRKPVRRKSPAKNTKKNGFLGRKIFSFMVVFAITILLMVGIYHYREGLKYYLGFKSRAASKEQIEDKRLSDVRNFQVLSKHQNNAIGIDVSEYQGTISWDAIGALEQKYPIHFVFIRATVGKDRLDRKFKDNWLGAKENKIICGAYHYYRPNENSLEQAALFIQTVQLNQGDLPPVLDIEQLPKEQSVARLKIGLRRWLQAIEAHYKVKPIIYTGEKYYEDFLKEEFGDYLFWIANYNFYREKIQEDWLFWQFTEKASLPGITGSVDVNIYNGDLQQLQFITIE
ncbi:glycoside hydrolase family 25 protein [Flavobacterium crassostreae]|uniref:Glycoside hydrolase n=1 Tax=Flavobacterium crassostreae TaxID=1763534 RepID=A0A1B9E3K7_9FLAO|nr:glycoside hydrolase family 25 protein [Flavobacterium crassostreae]OCB76533.1 glycoside hydrolase [Flavobacterium crassostreae]